MKFSGASGSRGIYGAPRQAWGPESPGVICGSSNLHLRAHRAAEHVTKKLPGADKARELPPGAARAVNRARQLERLTRSSGKTGRPVGDLPSRPRIAQEIAHEMVARLGKVGESDQPLNALECQLPEVIKASRELERSVIGPART